MEYFPSLALRVPADPEVTTQVRYTVRTRSSLRLSPGSTAAITVSEVAVLVWISATLVTQVLPCVLLMLFRDTDTERSECDTGQILQHGRRRTELKLMTHRSDSCISPIAAHHATRLRGGSHTLRLRDVGCPDANVVNASQLFQTTY